MTSPAPTARHPRAAIAWSTKEGIFVEYPHRDGGPPFICRYPLSTKGLQEALNILVEHPAPPPSRLDLNANHPAIKRKNNAEWATDAQRAKTREVLRRLGKI